MACAIFETFSCCFSKNINIKCLTYAGLCYTLCIITLRVQSADSCPRVYYLSQKTTAFLRTNWMAPLSLSVMEWHAFCAPSSRAWIRPILTATQFPPPPPPQKKEDYPTPDNLLSERQQSQIAKSNRYPLVASSSSITVNFMQMLTRFTHSNHILIPFTLRKCLTELQRWTDYAFVGESHCEMALSLGAHTFSTVWWNRLSKQAR